MARLAAWLVALAAVIVSHGLTVVQAGESLVWSTKSGSCESSGKTLVFVFNHFSAAEFSKSAGAFREDLSSTCQLCPVQRIKTVLESLPSTCVKNTEAAVDVDGSDIKAVIDAARSSTGVHAISMNVDVSKLNSMQDVLVAEAIEEAKKASQGNLVVVFSGKNSLAQDAERRTLQTATTPLLIRMAPDTFVGLVLLVLVHLLLIFTFCCCMDGVEAQSKYAKQYPMRGKELN